MITVLGWLATALVVASYAQASVARLRGLSLVASVLLIVFNTVLGIWSNVALEVALVVINLVRLLTRRDEEAATSPELDEAPAPDLGYALSSERRSRLSPTRVVLR